LPQRLAGLGTGFRHGRHAGLRGLYLSGGGGFRIIQRDNGGERAG